MKRDFIHVTDYSKEEIYDFLDSAIHLKKRINDVNDDYKPFYGMSLAMIFAKPSARTRVSFETGFFKLGGHALYLGPNDIGIGKREAVKDIGRVLSRYNDMIKARLYEHKHMLELSESATIPVVNGLTDYNHPCQIMADLLTIYEKMDSIDNVKIVYVGDGNNIVNSWIRLASILPFEFTCVCPEGYEPDKDTISYAKSKNLSTINISHNPEDGVKDADVIYTDVWASMGQKEEIDERIKIFSPLQVNEELVNHAKDNYMFMHCLPAERGREVTDEVIDSSNSVVFEQAENRLHTQNAIMVTLLDKL